MGGLRPADPDHLQHAQGVAAQGSPDAAEGPAGAAPVTGYRAAATSLSYFYCSSPPCVASLAIIYIFVSVILFRMCKFFDFRHLHRYVSYHQPTFTNLRPSNMIFNRLFSLPYLFS